MADQPPPKVPKKKPGAPVTPTADYLAGYRDGYSGTWLSPLHWIEEEYRGGWQAGAYDREHSLPSQYP